MHYPCLIVGPDPDAQLAPLFEHIKVAPYKVILDAADIKLMAEHFSIPEGDLAALATRMPEWSEEEGGVEEGRLYRWSTSNPQSKFDWYELGGRFEGFLRLKQPRQPTGWRKLIGRKPVERVNQALRSDIQEGPLLADPPTAVLRGGVWSECPFTSDAAELERWRQEFGGLFESIPSDALLTVMDIHS